MDLIRQWSQVTRHQIVQTAQLVHTLRHLEQMIVLTAPTVALDFILACILLHAHLVRLALTRSFKDRAFATCAQLEHTQRRLKAPHHQLARTVLQEHSHWRWVETAHLIAQIAVQVSIHS